MLDRGKRSKKLNGFLDSGSSAINRTITTREDGSTSVLDHFTSDTGTRSNLTDCAAPLSNGSHGQHAGSSIVVFYPLFGVWI